LFAAALHHAFPQVKEGGAPELQGPAITRCGNPTFGDFQCNNALALAKVLSRALIS
jgi:arginyl-tRNA synthetase